MKNRYKADFSLLLVTFVWGFTFSVTKNSLDFISPFNFLSLRFGLAFLISLLIFIKYLKLINKKLLLHSAFIGLFLFGGYALQTIGLQYTTVSNSGFITGLSVVLVPIISAILFKKIPRKESVIGVSLAFIGLFFMNFQNGMSINIGDLLTFFGAFCFGLHIISVGHFAQKDNPTVIAIFQIGFVSLYSSIASIFTESYIFPHQTYVLSALFITAFFATVGAYLIQNRAQQYTTSTRTALIFTMEPVFAGISGYFIGERMTYLSIIGGVLILIGMIISELKLFDKNKTIKTNTSI